MPIKAISLRYQIVGEIEEFLQDENMRCEHTKTGIVELVNQIATYKEEGKALFPEVYIIDSLSSIQKPLINADFQKIGRSEKSPKIILKALKKCAPLASGGWCIYILREENEFEYGVFRSGATLISVPISKILIDEGNQENSLIRIRQVADKIVEVQGVKGHNLIINFGIRSTSNLSPLEEQNKFVEQIIVHADPEIKDQLRIFYSKLFLFVMQNGHGNLCLVIAKDIEYPEFLMDGIILEKEIIVTDKIISLSPLVKESSYSTTPLEVNSKLNGAFNLIAGMIMSDGITIFSNNGNVLAYNVFVKHPVDDLELNKVEGGARSRTFEVLKRRLSNNIKAVYIQSQDGNTQTEIHE